MYKAIVFDLHGVIVRQGDESFWQPLSRSLGVTQAILFDTMHNDWIRFETGAISLDEFGAKVARKLGVTYDQDVMWHNFVDRYEKTHPVQQPMLRLVDAIHKKGYVTAILSNTNEPHVELNRKRGIEKHFDVCLYSNELKALKPDKAAYQKMLRALKLKPEEVVFIDDLAINLETPREMGIYCIKFDNISKLKQQLRRLEVSF